jgi:uncharacterized protein (TIGR02117 family)
MKFNLFHMNIIFPLFVLFLNTSPQLVEGQQDTSINSFTNVYLVKNNWHTGIVFKVNDVLHDLPEISEFKNYNYVDIGWGDADFYQYPEFDAGLAVKALFYPTGSAIRVEAFNLTIERYIELSDMAVLIKMNNTELSELLNFISNEFYKDDEKLVELSRRYSGHIVYYHAKGKYHLFNTCNTWVAKGLRNSGIEIKDKIILAEQLFREAAERGEVLKVQEVE